MIQKKINAVFNIMLLLATLFSLSACVTTTSSDLDATEKANNNENGQLSETSKDNKNHNTITSVDVKGDQLIIYSDNKLTYTSVKHIVPSPGVVFYFPDTILANIDDFASKGSKYIKSIVVRQQDIHGPYAKVEVVLSKDVAYDTKQNDNQLKVLFSSQQDIANDSQEKNQGIFSQQEDMDIKPHEEKQQISSQQKETNIDSQEENKDLASNQKGMDIKFQEVKQHEHVIDLEESDITSDIEPVKQLSPFSIETTPFSRNALIQVNASKPINDYRSSIIKDPPKIVFDLYNVQSPDRNMVFSVGNNPFVKEVRTFRYPKRLRMVIDTVPEYISAYRAYPAEEGLSIYIGLDLPGFETVKASEQITKEGDSSKVSVQPITDAEKLLTASSAVNLPQDHSPVAEALENDPFSKDLQLEQEISSGDIRQSSDVLPNETSSINHTKQGIKKTIPQPVLSTEPDFQAIFKTPKPKLKPGSVSTKSKPSITSESKQLMPKALSPFSEWQQAGSTINSTLQPKFNSFYQPSTMIDSYAQKGIQKKYSGEKIAIDFYETDIKNVFRILREVSGHNFAIDSDVSGKVTLTLKKPVPWDQILDLILKMNKLGITYESDIIRISQLSTIRKEQEERIAKIESEIRAAKKREELLEPVLTHYIPVNYARAVDLTKHLEKVTTKERGSVSVDERTNTIIISDVKERIQRALSVVHNLDKPNLQVMIETRIIEVTNNFSRDIGVNWSGTVGIQPGDAAEGIGPQRGYDVLGGTYGYNWAVNYPAATNSNIGINFRRLTGLTPFTLDAQLSAMESKGEIRILTSPRIVALDNKQATIEQGLEYPINSLDDKGNTITEFKDVDLDLKVTPHITQDGRVSMLIDTSKNDLGPVVNGKQSFQKKQAKTELLVNDGDTVVIGGIMKTVRNTSKSGVPLLSRLPMIGWLFSTHTKSDDKEELIIFITPKIIKLENKALVKKTN